MTKYFEWHLFLVVILAHVFNYTGVETYLVSTVLVCAQPLSTYEHIHSIYVYAPNVGDTGLYIATRKKKKKKGK